MQMASTIASAPRVGRHYGPAGPGLPRAAAAAATDGASAIQVFAGAPLSYSASRSLSDDALRSWLEATHDMARLVHGSYYLMLSEVAESPKFPLIVAGIIEQLTFAAHIGAEALVIHAGSNKAPQARQNASISLASICAAMDAAALPPIRLLLENGAGRTGFGVDVLAELLASHDDPRLGLCLDTAHAYGHGDDVERIIEYATEPTLGAVHLNAPNPDVGLGSGRDRHNVALCDGAFAVSEVEALVRAFAHLPLIIEGTPLPGVDYALVRQVVGVAAAEL